MTSKDGPDRAEKSINELFEIIEEHLASLPEDEARERLKSIDKAHATARAADARIRERRSRKRPTQKRTLVTPALSQTSR
jgi:hypothetical protein